jgi:hypothetical protein
MNGSLVLSSASQLNANARQRLELNKTIHPDKSGQIGKEIGRAFVNR